jgi:hypothetical protein
MLISALKESFLIFLLGILCAFWIFSFQIVGLASSLLFFFLIFFILINLVNANLATFNSANKIFLILLIINFFYFILGLFEYSKKSIDLSYLLEYFFKETLLILFTIFSSLIFRKEKNLNLFFLGLFSFLIPLMILYFIYYQFYLSADFIGSKVDFIMKESREGKNTLSYSLSVVFPFFFVYLYKKFLINNKILFLSLVTFYLLFTYKVDSTASNLSLLIIFFSFLFISFSKKKPQISFFFILIFLLFFFYKIDLFLYGYDFIFEYYHNKKSLRLELSTYALTKSINDSFLGFGTATSRIYKDIFSYELHNVYLTYLYEKGIVGFFFYIFFYFYTFFALFKKNFKIVSYEMAALLSLISNLFLFFFINVEVSPLLWILNAISVGILYKNK